MNIWCLRQICLIDLHHRAHHHEVPIRTRLSNAPQQLKVEALVYNSKEPHTRCRDGSLVGRINDRLAGAGEMLRINAAGKRMHAGMVVALGFIEALASGKYQVSEMEKIFFLDSQRRWSALEGGELVHAIVDYRQWLQVLAEAERHRCVIPADILLDVVLDQKAVQHLTL